MDGLLATLVGLVVTIMVVVDVWPRTSVGIALFTGAFCGGLAGVAAWPVLRLLLRLLHALSRIPLALRAPHRFARGEDDADDPPPSGLARVVAPEVVRLVGWGAAGALGSLVASIGTIALAIQVARLVHGLGLELLPWGLALTYAATILGALAPVGGSILLALHARQLAIELTPPRVTSLFEYELGSSGDRQLVVVENPIVFLGYVGIVCASLPPVVALATVLPLVAERWQR